MQTITFLVICKVLLMLFLCNTEADRYKFAILSLVLGQDAAGPEVIVLQSCQSGRS